MWKREGWGDGGRGGEREKGEAGREIERECL